MSLEVVKIGPHTLHCGSAEEVLPTLGGFDLALIDPPYGIGEHGGKRRFGPQSEARGFASHRDYRNAKWDSEPPSRESLAAIISLAPKAIVWGANHFISRIPNDSPSWLVWHKKGADKSDFADCELAWSNLGCAVKYFRHDWVGFGAINSGVRREHPTQKPVELMRWCLTLAPNAARVIDSYMGSGTTGVACVKEKRIFTGIERDREYFDIACRRIERAMADDALPLFGEKPAQLQFGEAAR